MKIVGYIFNCRGAKENKNNNISTNCYGLSEAGDTGPLDMDRGTYGPLDIAMWDPLKQEKTILRHVQAILTCADRLLSAGFDFVDMRLSKWFHRR